MRDHRRGRIFIVIRDHDFHTVGRQYFEHSNTRRFRKCVCVDTQKQWSIDTLLPAVLADSLADGKDMPFVETAFERGTTMPRGAEGDSLFRY